MKRLDRAAALATAAGLALCALLAFVYNDALDSPEVEIVVNGEVVERLSLAGEPRDITVRAGGGFNVVRVGDGRALVFADGAHTGTPASFISSSATLWSGMRTATVS